MSIETRKLTYYDIFRSSHLPRLETEVLLSFLTGKTREYLMAHPEMPVSPAVYKKFRLLESKRLENWPLAYLTGRKEFYGLDFFVSPAVLVPRPESEMIVEEVLSLIEKTGPAEIIDIGTGSGAIIVAVASEMRRLFPAGFKRSNFSASDISGRALAVAKQNIITHKLQKKIRPKKGDLLLPAKKNLKSDFPLIITANLPYLTPSQIKKSPSIRHEPKLALDGGTDGLKYYCRLFEQLKKSARKLEARVICEIDPSQAKPAAVMVKKHFPSAFAETKKDLAGINRLLIITIAASKPKTPA